jgi:hypothetical protein
VPTAFYLLIGLIGVTPALLFVTGPIFDGLLSAYTAVLVALVGISIRPGEAGYLSQVIRPTLIIALIPAAWMFIQILPIPVSSIINPIWISAQAALNHTVLASISIDRGATLLAFMKYCFAVSVIFIAAAVTIDRARAELVLFWLVGITTLAAIILIGRETGALKLIAETTITPSIPSLTALAAMGVVINAAAAVRAIERYETRRSSIDAPFAKFVWTFILCVVALTICASTVVVFANPAVVFATMSGLAAFIIIMIIRRLGLGPLVNIFFALTAVVIAIMIIITNSGSGDLTLRFGFDASSALIQNIQSVLSDTPWVGNGAGSLSSLMFIYQDIDRTFVGPYAPTTAATVAIELGRPALWIILVMVFRLLIQLLRGALQRGRDSFYPTAGASCLVLFVFEAFCDASILERSTIIISATILGLAFAQSVSRTNQTNLARQN